MYSDARRTYTNVDRAETLVRSDRKLSIHLTAENCIWIEGRPSGRFKQRICEQQILYSRVPGYKPFTKINSPRPYSLELAICDLGIFPKLRNTHEKTKSWFQTTHDYITETYSERQVPRMLPAMVLSFHEVYNSRGEDFEDEGN